MKNTIRIFYPFQKTGPRLLDGSQSFVTTHNMESLSMMIASDVIVNPLTTLINDGITLQFAARPKIQK